MKLLYRIPDHRPSENEERNKSLFELKRKHPDWSFGELAIRYRSSHPDDRITDKHAERCYKQHEQRLALKMKRVLNSRDVHLQAKSLSEEELRNELPSPEYILDILTGATE